MKIRNFTLSGEHFALVARVSGNEPVFDLIFEDSAIEGLTFDRLRLTLSQIQEEINDLIESNDVADFNLDWSGKIAISDGNGGFEWGYLCDEKRHAD